MNTVAAIDALIALTQLAANLMQNANAVSAIVKKAQAEGRSELTNEEWVSVQQADSTAKDLLMASIAQALKQ